MAARAFVVAAFATTLSAVCESIPEFDVTVGDVELGSANVSLIGARRLKASVACQACCSGGDCSVAFKGVEAGSCCSGGDRKSFWCCPSAASKCATRYGHCMSTKTVVSHTTRVGREHINRVHSSVSPLMSIGGLMIFVAGIVLVCYVCAKTQKYENAVAGQGQIGPNGNQVVYGQPIGQPCGSGNGALYGGMGFLGGLTMGSMMMGPGWGGYGYGGGYGDSYMTETTTTEMGGGEFMGDGGDFGAGGFGGDFGGGGFDMGMGGDF